jgi:gliding motility-associated-like protein
MTVTVITPAGPTVTSPVDYCNGATVVQPLSATGAGLLWYTSATGGTGSSSAPTIPTPVTTASTYYVTQTINGCESPRVPVQVTVSAPNFSIDAGAPLYIALGSGAQANPVLTGITSGQLSSILWTPPTGLDNPSTLNPIITPAADGTYTYDVTITNAIGCTATDQLVVNVSSECIHVKNAFTPNGDGINELWEVYDQYSCLKNVKVHVYNRYGSKVYESDDYRNNWDGKFKGKPLPDGTYYAVIEFSLMTGKVYTVRTDVSILR